MVTPLFLGAARLLPLVALLLAVLSSHARADGCFDLFSNGFCGQNVSGSACFLLCSVCTQPHLAFALAPRPDVHCDKVGAASDAAVYAAATQAFFNASALQGYTWLDDAGDVEAGAAECFQYILQHLPRRDLLVLAARPFEMAEFYFEHVRYALLARRSFAFARNVSWPLFLDAVLPPAFLNEKRDYWWHWRPRLYQALAPVVAQAENVTAAVHLLTATIPTLQLQGVLADTQGRTYAGPPVSWRSESSPAYLSPQQTVQMGSSCTGTGILLAAACRAVGIPARIAGCSESVVQGDDHHWIEFFDPLSPGPFGDSWHTREGVSAGASDGPWDAPSGPMGGCLQGVQPGDPLRTIWSSAWGSPQFLPLLWASDAYAQTWAFVGGENRCGAYCTAWGCGPQRDQHYSQAACAPSS